MKVREEGHSANHPIFQDKPQQQMPRQPVVVPPWCLSRHLQSSALLEALLFNIRSQRSAVIERSRRRAGGGEGSPPVDPPVPASEFCFMSQTLEGAGIPSAPPPPCGLRAGPVSFSLVAARGSEVANGGRLEFLRLNYPIAQRLQIRHRLQEETNIQNHVRHHVHFRWPDWGRSRSP